VTLVEKWSGRKPSLGHLRTFGCIEWDHILDDRREKLDANSHACIIMGYFEELKAHILFEYAKQEIVYGRYVVFNENTLGISLLNETTLGINLLNYYFELLRNDPWKLQIITDQLTIS
jgi:hypothetical protein